MKEILTDKMLHEIFTALEKGEPFEYSDANTQITINPQGISIQYKSNIDDAEIEDFLHYCDKLDDDLFIEVCESFQDHELEQLQKQLDTPKYKETIQTFTQRVKEVANNRLAEITNAATAEIQRLEQVILDSRNAIYSLRAEIENANVKYAL
jgi:hypothetical protein